MCHQPLHPYTKALFAASLSSHPDEEREGIVLSGEVPSALTPAIRLPLPPLVGPKLFDFIDVEMPTIKDGECLIKLERVSICGSDVRHGYGPIYPEEQYPLAAGRPCHECAGVIVESRTDTFHEGQRVIVLPGAGMGGLTEYLASTPGRMIALPDHGDLTE